MKVKLSDDREVRVGISHITTQKKIRGKIVDVRGTKVWLAEQGGLTAEATAMCSPEDNFCKRAGRRLAANRLLTDLKGGLRPLSKQDRRTIFQVICPEYAR